MYQMMLLPGTEMSTLESRKKYGFITKYRVVPRAFGYYDCGQYQVSTGDIEEIVVATDTLSYSDYISCREFALIVNVFFNDSIFDSVTNFISTLGLSIYDWLLAIYSLKDQYPSFAALISAFVEESESELWDSKYDLMKYLSVPENVDLYINGDKGSNLIYKYKARSILLCLEDLKKLVIDASSCYIQRSLASDISVEIMKNLRQLIEDLSTHDYQKMINLFDPISESLKLLYKTDISCFISGDSLDLADSNRLLDCLSNIVSSEGVEIEYFHSSDQIEIIESYKNAFGCDESAVSRILSRIFLRQAFKHYKISSSGKVSLEYRQIIDKRLAQA